MTGVKVPQPNRVVLVLMKGKEIGLTVLQSLQFLFPVNGIISMYGDGLFAFCLAQPDKEYIEEDYDIETKTYICRAKRKGRNEIKRTFSKEQAEKSGLLKKEGVWRLYPERMSQMRVRSWCLRDTWADKLNGVIAYEEALDCVPYRSNVLSFEQKILEGTKEYLNFIIQNTNLPQERIKKMLAWAGVESVDLMNELKAMQAINALKKEYPDAEKAWRDGLISKLEGVKEEGTSHA